MTGPFHLQDESETGTDALLRDLESGASDLHLTISSLLENHGERFDEDKEAKLEHLSIALEPFVDSPEHEEAAL